MSSRSTPLPAIVLLIAGSVVGCGHPPSHVPIVPGDPVAKGRADADADIAAGRPLRQTAGDPSPDDTAVDPTTGLPFRNGFGCNVDASVRDYIKSYNEAIDAARAAGRLAGMDLKARLMSREAAIASIERSGRRVACGDPPVVSPDGSRRISLRQPPAQRPQQGFEVRIERPDGVSGIEYWTVRETLTVAFDHGGATAIIRDDSAGRISTLDLPREQWLQRFERDRR